MSVNDFKCPLSVLWICPSSRVFGYSKMTEKWSGGSAPGVRLIEKKTRFHVTIPLFRNRSKCGTDIKVAHEAIAECVTIKIKEFCPIPGQDSNN